MMSTKPILVTGATGYIGGRLVPQLLAQGLSRPLPGPRPGQASRPGLGGPRSRSSRATCSTATRSARPWRAAVPRITWSTRWLAARGPSASATFWPRELRGGRRGGRPRPDHLPRRPGPAIRATLDPPDEPPRGRRRAPRRSRAHHRAERGHDHRLGQRVVRDAPRAGLPAARDGLPALGHQSHPADRHPQRPGLPDRLPGEPGDRRAGLRHRRAGRPDLQGDDGAVRQDPGQEAPDHRRAGA